MKGENPFVLESVVRCARDMAKDRVQGAVGPDTALQDIGIDSLGVMTMFVMLEAELGYDISGIGIIDRKLDSPRDLAMLLTERFGPYPAG